MLKVESQDTDPVSELALRRRFGYHLSSAFLAAVIARALSLILVKILSNVLPRIEFSSYSLWFAVVTFAAVTSTSPYSASLWRFMETRRKEGRRGAAQLISTSIVASFAALACFAVVLAAIYGLSGLAVVDDPFYMTSLLFATFLSCALILKELILVVSGTEQNSKEVISFNVLFSIASVSGASACALYFGSSNSALLGLGFGYLLPLLVALALQLKRYGHPLPCRSDFGLMLRFGGPNLVVTFSSTAIPVVSSLLVMAMIGLPEVATLAIALTLSNVLSLAIGPPFTAYQAYIVRTYENNQFDAGSRITERLIELFIVFSTVAVWGMFLFSSFLIEFISSPEYLGASSLILFTALAVVLIYLSYFWKLRVDLARKTHYTGAVHIVGLLSFMLFCSVFTSTAGLIGVGLAMLLHSVVVLLLTVFVGNKFMPIRMDSRFLLRWSSSVFIMVTSYVLLEGMGISYPISSAISSVLYAIAVAAMKIVKTGEIRAVFSMLVRKDNGMAINTVPSP